MNQLLLVWDEHYEERELAAPTLVDVAERLSALDGVNYTLLTLYIGDSHIACGGSAETGLVVYVTFDDGTFWQLVNPGQEKSEVTVVAGGQAGNYPVKNVVCADAAMRAFTRFFETGELASGEVWENSGGGLAQGYLKKEF